MVMENAHSHAILSRLLEKHTGQVVAANRSWRLESTLKPIMRQYAIPDAQALAAVIDSGTDSRLELDCVEAMLNNETCFFRDQANFALLMGPLLDTIRENRSREKSLRIWSAACSTGQEPYSIAMMFCENAEKWRDWKIEIMATDVSAAALKHAKVGRYSQFEIQRGLPVVMMLKYFGQVGEEWIMRDDLRNMISFRQHNMLNPSHQYGKFDVILCRNMLMYLSEDKRQIVLNNIASLLNIGGMVMLGAAETVIGQTEKLQASREFRGFYEASGHATLHRGLRRQAAA
jgi:chemotaxis protein methyltransferase CheR